MDEKFQSKIRKLFETRLNLENELLKGHSLLLEYIENNSRTTKIDNAVYKCKIALEKAVDVNEQLIRLAGKTENPEKVIAQQDLWLKKVTEMNDKVMHEAQSYKMSLEPSSFPAAGITGSKGFYNKLGLRHPRARTKQVIQQHEYLKTGLRSLISLRIVESLTHISLINLLPLVIRRLFALCHQVRNGMS